jgi:hypothetical protein
MRAFRHTDDHEQSRASMSWQKTRINCGHVFTLETIPNPREIQDYLANNKYRTAAIVCAGFTGLDVSNLIKQSDRGENISVFPVN